MKKRLVSSSQKSPYIVIIAYSSVQIFLILAYLSRNRIDSKISFGSNNIRAFDILFIAIILLLNLLGIALVRSFVKGVKLESQFLVQKASLENIIALHNNQRYERHDFANHLHVIYNLMDLDRYDSAKNYIKRVYLSAQERAMIEGTGVFEVDALIQSKRSYSQRVGVTLELDAYVSLEDADIESWLLVRIIGNILDNAIYAASLSKDIKLVRIEIGSLEYGLYIRICNSGTKISKEEQKKIFEIGYSTKGEKGHGLGLSIVNNILKEVSGTIDLESNESMTCFSISLKRRKHERGIS